VRIDVTIERLVLDGIDLSPPEHAHLQAEVESELARLLVDGGTTGLLATGGRVPAVATPTIGVSPSAGGAALGGRVAAAVAEGLTR
jgi:hypothetical protein